MSAPGASAAAPGAARTFQNIPINENCPVCHDALNNGAPISQCPKAYQHLFHKACIDQWLQRNPICPTCRAAVQIPRHWYDLRRLWQRANDAPANPPAAPVAAAAAIEPAPSNIMKWGKQLGSAGLSFAAGVALEKLVKGHCEELFGGMCVVIGPTVKVAGYVTIAAVETFVLFQINKPDWKENLNNLKCIAIGAKRMVM